MGSDRVEDGEQRFVPVMATALTGSLRHPLRLALRRPTRKRRMAHVLEWAGVLLVGVARSADTGGRETNERQRGKVDDDQRSVDDDQRGRLPAPNPRSKRARRCRNDGRRATVLGGQMVVDAASGHERATVHWPSSSSTSNVSRSTRVDTGSPGAITRSRLSAVASSIRLPTVRCGCGSGNAPPYGGQSGNASTKVRVICLKRSNGSGDKNRTPPGNRSIDARVASNGSIRLAIAATSRAVSSSTTARNG
ncbi:MAG: hypothetical protein JWM34_4425 [Ilumatobacteraceae bacterium]|nr:hypothetical protein [Ilumatobacteraceae bacterium]